MPARQRQTAHQRNAQRKGQRDLEGLAAFAGEKLLLALQKVVGRVVDARARHKRKDARQQKNRHRGLVADGKEPRAAGQRQRGDQRRNRRA